MQKRGKEGNVWHNRKKGQAAIDFLTTYGWSFAIILIMVFAMTYLGFFKPPLPQHCTMEAGFICAEDTYDESTGDFIIAIQNTKGYMVEYDQLFVEAINTDCSDLPATVNLGATAVRNTEREAITFSCDTSLVSGGVYEFDFQLTYRRHLGQISQVVTGKLFKEIP